MYKFSKLTLLTALPILFLASCSQNLTKVDDNKDSSTLTKPDYSVYLANQEKLKTINFLDLKGKVGIIKKEDRYSASFFYNSYPNKNYLISLNNPYNAKQYKVQKIGDRYFYTEDRQAYTAKTKKDFAVALFGFDVPLDKLSSLLVGIADVPLYSPRDKSLLNPMLQVKNNLVNIQVLDNGIVVNYSDYRTVGDFPVPIPYRIDITKDDQKVKILFNDPYTYKVYKQ